MTRSCEGCEHHGIRDYGYGPHERHDAYCWLYGIWTPSRCGDYNDQDYETTNDTHPVPSAGQDEGCPAID